MKIHIFTYGIRGNSDNWGWNSIFPDPEMAQYSEFGQGTVPDMLLYNSDSTHYDLLVKDNSRLAVLGLISISEEKEAEKEVALKEVAQKEAALKAVAQKEVAPKEVAHKEVAKEELDKEKPTSGVKGDRNEEQWKTVNNSRKKSVPRSKNSKAPGGDLTSAPSKEKACDTNKCKECNFRADSVQQLNNHMRTHDETVIPYYCEVCQEEFDSHTEYNNHNKKKHSKQWNCDDCDFQASTRGGLLTHCKLTSGHKPSRVQKSKSGVLKCYTCKSEFRSYHELMEHRKEEHPSHKTCRNYIKGECFFSADECWYLHEDNSHVNTQTVTKDKICFGCMKTFPTNFDLLEHKKKSNMCKTLCTKFQNGNCDWSEENCSFRHILENTQTSTTSPNNNVWTKPL